MSINDTMEKNASKIIGIQFSILSPDEIRKGSVAEITSRDTYINNKPIIGGLFDPRMGVLDPGLICPTDGLDYINTPGYFGHINLARPVFYIQYINTIIKIVRCICIKCSKLLISKDKYKELYNLNADNRWNQIFTIASKIKRCGEATDNGCGCKQPTKIKKENLATLIAEWDNVEGLSTEESKLSLKLTPEKIIKLFRRISDDDMTFMGFSPKWSRPEWMVCQVLAVPPPAVRPSIKHDSQQRSEDDITHIIVNIIKSNKTLLDKISQDAQGSVIDDWTTVLQYYIATLVDNKIPGVAAVAQRSGRPLKSIKERLNGKTGRVRGNLMGKRVDYSARSVITPDPQLSIRELGVPLKIAKNLTKPVLVNNKNIKYLLKLVRNGPDIYPGAKILEKKNGENISLRYIDKESIKLQIGDKVHRHMLNGDFILFNRQPTLHKMSMMAHITKIMPQGDTFRMNVGDTKPYNADFDGDEMNLHLPQDAESETELAMLASIPNQIISPANNKSIIGIFQDSLLGSYLFTDKKKQFDTRYAMNLMIGINKLDINKFPKNMKEISNFDILSQILPPISLDYKTKKFKDSESYSTSNNVLNINNGYYIRGQIEKGVLGDGSKGLIQRIYNDYGPLSAANFIDNLQNIVTEYMKYNSYSVGISDLIADDKTDSAIADIISEKKKSVHNLIDETHLGIFENKSGKSNEQEFETKVNNILNQASLEAGKIGRSNLDKNNRFVIMVNAGSKGSDLNIAQMISCLGQQNVDGKRIPYGFDDRTLPHYNKYDDSPSARGFIENSFIGGLTPTELFFHAMGGRVGLIDTAVKTSQTGYISRRLIKSLEDLMVHYDMTVRNNKNKIIQFSYGDDNFDPIKVEFQMIPLVQMSMEDIYNYFQISYNTKDKVILEIFTNDIQKQYRSQKGLLNQKIKSYIDYMLIEKNRIVKNVFKNIYNKQVHLPVAFTYIINNIVGQFNLNINSQVDISPLEAYQMIEDTYKMLETSAFIKPNDLFKVLYYFYLSPKQLLVIKRFNKNALTYLLDTIVKQYKQSIVNPGEMVGIIAAQSIGEPTTQMSALSSERNRFVKINKRTKEINSISEEIGLFCDKIINRYPEYTFNTEYANSVETILDKLEDEYYIIGVDKQENTHWNKISHISRHPVNGNIMKITTKSGRVVETTTSHSHLIRKDQTVKPITGSDMIIGMRIPVAKYIKNIYINDTILIGNKNYKLDYNIGWFIGAYLAEGNINGSQICITNISEYFINNTIKIAELFNNKYVVKKYKGEYGPSVSTSFNNKEFAKFIKQTCNTGSFIKKVPEFAFVAPNEFKAGLIQAYFDGDGNFQNDKNHHQIRVCSRSKQLIKDIALLLNYFSIFGTIKEHSIKKQPMYNLSISPKYSKIYKKNINTLLHLDKLDELVKYIGRTNIHSLSDDIDRINGVGAIIAKCGKILKLPGQSRTYGRWKNKESIGRRTLEKYINIFENNNESNNIREELNILKQAVNSSVIWDEIISIETYTPDQTEFVYDFTVPKNQTFMTDYGIIIHNTLNTFHFAGVASKSNVTRGVPRIEEILALSENPKNPSCTIYLPKEIEHDQEQAQKLINVIEHTKLRDIVQTIEICFDPDDFNTLIEVDKPIIDQYKEFSELLDDCIDNKVADNKQKSKWIIRMEMNKIEMLDKNITMEDVHFALKYTYQNDVVCIYSDYNSDSLIFRIRLNNILKNKKKNKQTYTLDQSDEIYILKNFQDELLDNLILRGIKNISNILLRKITDSLEETDGNFNKKEIWVLDTVGSNLLKILSLDNIDVNNTVSNNIQEIYRVLGIEAARQSIYNELVEVIEFDSTYINYHHLSILCDRMTCNSTMTSVFRHGINNDNIGPIAKASFEETPEQFLKAARHAELDNMRGVSANIMCGQDGYFGTSSFNVLLNINEVIKHEESQKFDIKNKQNLIENEFGDIIDPNDPCGINNISIPTNINTITQIDLGEDDDYDPFA